MKLAVSYRVIKLALANNAKKLAVAIGNFIYAKFFTETPTVSESISKESSKGFSDGFEVQESIDVLRGKNVFNPVVFSDGETYFLQDYIAEDYVLPSQCIREFYKNGLDFTITVADQPAIQYNKAFAEAVLVTDYLDGELDKTDKTIDFFKASDNVPVVSDSFSRQVNFVRSFSDLASIAESKAISLSRGVSDSAAVTDLFSYEIFIGVNLSDSSSASDAGSLLAQGYTDSMTYFAEDYVGSSRTF